jgi:peptidyl-prolyl cis-trans isomerase SurA
MVRTLAFNHMPNHPVRKRFLAHVVAAAMLPMAVAGISSADAQPVEINGIAAKVNGKVITRSQLAMMLAPIRAQLVAQYPRRGAQFEAELTKAKEGVLQELIDRRIILDEFKQLGAEMRSSVVEEEIKRQIRDLYQGDQSKFLEELKRNRLTMEGFREMTREKLVVQAMRAQQFSDAPPPLPDEVRREYEEVKHSLRDTSGDVLTFRKIFIHVLDSQNPANPPEMQLALAEDVARRATAGEDFAVLAKEHSKDAHAAAGGLQENVPRTDLSPEFAALVVDGGEGSIFGPLRDREGFTVVQVIRIQYGPVPSLEQVREAIEQRVSKRKTSAQYERWMESRRKRAMIDIRG